MEAKVAVNSENWSPNYSVTLLTRLSLCCESIISHLRNGEVCGVLYVAGLLVNQREGRVHALILGSVFALLIQGRFLRGRASLRLTVHWRRKHLLKVQTTIHSVSDLGEQTSGTIAITKLTNVVKRFLNLIKVSAWVVIYLHWLGHTSILKKI